MEFSELNKEEIWNRQNGMCGICGKKIEELQESVEYDFYKLPHDLTPENDPSNWAMLCGICQSSAAAASGKNGMSIKLKKYHFPFGNFTTYDYSSLLSDITADVEQCFELAKSSEEFKEIRNRCKDLSQLIKNLNIESEHRDSLLATINQAFESLNSRQNEAQKKQDDNYNEIYSQFKIKIDEAIAQAKESSDFRLTRESLAALQNEFKDIRLKQEHRDLISDMIGAAFDDLNRRQTEERESYEMECIENFHNIKNIVDEAVNFALTSDQFRQARAKLIAAQNEFKGLKLKKEQREEQYSRIQGAFDELNRRQRQEWEVYLSECDDNYMKLKEAIDAAVEFATTTEDFKEARERLITAQNEFKGLKLKKEQREEQYSRIQAAFDDLNHRQREDWNKYETECNENMANLQALVDTAISNANTLPDFRTIRESLISIQNQVKEAKLKKEHRNQLFKKIRQGFDILDNRRMEYRDNRKAEKMEKLEAILANLEGKIARLEESIQRDREAQEIQTQKLSEVRPGEKEDEVKEEINEKIENIKSRIQEKELSLAEITTRIEDIKKELSII